MVEPKIRVEIKPDTKATFDWLDRVLDPAINAAAVAATELTTDDIVEYAFQSCPVDTGDMRSTIRKTHWKKAGGLFARVYVVVGGIRGKITGKMVDYPMYVEYGTSRQRPQPFIRPSVKKGVKNFFAHFAVEYKRRVPR